MTIYRVGKSLLQMSLDKALKVAQSGDTLLISEGQYFVTGSHAQGLNLQAAQPESPPNIHGHWELRGGHWTFKHLKLYHDADITLFLEGATAAFEDCHLQSLQNSSIYVEKADQASSTQPYTVELDRVTFGAGERPGLFLWGATARIDDCWFNTTTSNAISVKNSGSVSVSNSRFASSPLPLLYASEGGHITLKFCQFNHTAANTVILEEKGRAEISDCRFSGYEESDSSIFWLEAQSQAVITRCTFENVARNVINSTNSEIFFSGCEFRNITNKTALVTEDSILNVSECIFSCVGGNTIYNEGSQIKISACIFEHKPTSSPSIVFKKNSQAEVEKSSFLKNDSIALVAEEDSKITVTDCEIQSISEKTPIIFLENAEASISNCALNGSRACIFADKTTATITNCHFDKVTHFSPLEIISSQVTAKDCTFSDIIAKYYIAFAAGEGTKLSLSGAQLEGREAVAIAIEGAQIDLTGSTFDINAIDEESGGVVLYPGRNKVATSGPAPSNTVTPAPPPVTQPSQVPELLEQGLNELNSLIGLGEVKAEVNKLVALVKLQQRREAQGLPSAPVTLHLVFTGNPGTGKTTVARIIGKIYRGLGLLSTEKVIETDRSGLVGEHIGHTAPKTLEKINEALDGILFIDEAYSLVVKDTGNDFGREAIDTLLKQMEDNRHRLAVIVAGYTGKMQEFIASNPGLASRFTRTIHFADYGPDELLQIFEKLCHDSAYYLSPTARDMLAAALAEVYTKRDQNFGNGRDVRTIFENIVEQHALRISEDFEADLSRFEVIDIEAALNTWKRI